MPTTAKRSGKAVVIGASMAGLLAGSALARHFQHVILLERDTFPAAGENRKGVPQGKHIHILLERGRGIMESFLPGLTADLVALGAVKIADASAQVRWFHSGGYHRAGTGDLGGVAVSRPTLEAAVRQRVLALPNVTINEACNVLELTTTADNRRVTGVRLRRRRDGGEEETIEADLVVDATGRGSRSPAWLEALGYGRPEDEEVHIGMGYTTCHYRRRPDHIPGWEGISILATPPDKRLAAFVAQEGNRWVLTIGGYLGEHVPADTQAFLAAARQLPAPEIYEVIKDAERLDGPVLYKFPANLRRHYEKMDDFPAGYVVIGDALCSFNPIYGQGMTVASMEAVALDEWLAADATRAAHNFFARTTKIIDLAWDTAAGSDLSYPAVEGKRTLLTRFLNWYLGKLHIAAHHDATVSLAFLKVVNMVAPPPTVLHPRIMWRVLKGNLRAGRRQEEATTEAALTPHKSMVSDH